MFTGKCSPPGRGLCEVLQAKWLVHQAGWGGPLELPLSLQPGCILVNLTDFLSHYPGPLAKVRVQWAEWSGTGRVVLADFHSGPLVGGWVLRGSPPPLEGGEDVL